MMDHYFDVANYDGERAEKAGPPEAVRNSLSVQTQK